MRDDGYQTEMHKNAIPQFCLSAFDDRAFSQAKQNKSINHHGRKPVPMAQAICQESQTRLRSLKIME